MRDETRALTRWFSALDASKFLPWPWPCYTFCSLVMSWKLVESQVDLFVRNQGAATKKCPSKCRASRDGSFSPSFPRVASRLLQSNTLITCSSSARQVQDSTTVLARRVLARHVVHLRQITCCCARGPECRARRHTAARLESRLAFRSLAAPHQTFGEASNEQQSGVKLEAGCSVVVRSWSPTRRWLLASRIERRVRCDATRSCCHEPSPADSV